MYTVKPVGDKFSICQDDGDAIPEMMFDTEVEAQSKVDEMNKADEAKAYAVKFIGANRVRGYAAIWGDANHPDLSSTKDYFTPQTDFWDNKLGMPRPLTYHHGFELNTKGAPIIGTIDKLGQDEIGKWYEAELDKSHKYADAIKKLIERGALKSSSDSVPQYVQRERQANGANWLKSWALFGVSLTPTPAEPRMYAVQELKSLYQTIGNALQLPEAQAETTQESGASAAKASDDQKPNNHKENEMDENKIAEIVAAQLKAAEEAKQKEAEAKAAFDAQVKAEAQKLFDAQAKSNRAPIFNMEAEGKTRIVVASKYDGMNLDDLAFLAAVRGEAKSIGRSHGADEQLLRALAARSFKAVESGNLEAKAMQDLAVKSNEIDQSTLASYGDEWVGVNYSTQLWAKVRGQAMIAASLPQRELPKGFESENISIESADPTFYNVAQAADEDGTMKTPVATVTSSKIGTGKVAVTIGKLGARVSLTGELDEDSIIDAIPQFRSQMEVALAEDIDFVLANADQTAATDNINGDGTPASTADYYVLPKGLIRVGLKENSAANATSLATFSSANIRTMYSTLGTDGLYVWSAPEKCVVFCDYLTYSKLMGLSDLLTVANSGERFATIVTGDNGRRELMIHGVKWVPSVGVRKAQASGVRHGTESSNTKGRAVLVRPDQWQMLWKRRAKFETTRIARADVTELVVTVRFGLGYFDTEAAAVGYNIG